MVVLIQQNKCEILLNQANLKYDLFNATPSALHYKRYDRSLAVHNVHSQVHIGPLLQTHFDQLDSQQLLCLIRSDSPRHLNSFVPYDSSDA